MVKLIKRVRLPSAFLKVFVFRGARFTIEKYRGTLIFKVEREGVMFEYRANALRALRVGAHNRTIHVSLNNKIRLEIAEDGTLTIKSCDSLQNIK